MTVVPSPETNGVTLLAALEAAGAIKDTSLELPADLDYETYESIGAMFAHLDDKLLWLMGDWLNYGEHAYGQKYAQAAELLAKDPQQLANIASVAHRVKPRQRSKVLKFWVHEPIAKLSAPEQRKWIRQAEQEHLSRSRLRQLVNGETEEQYEDVSREVCETCGRPL